MPKVSTRGLREGLLLGVSLAVPMALIIAFVGYGYINLKTSAVQRGWTLVEAVVASRPLATGETLAPEDLEVRQVVVELMTKDAVPPAQLSDPAGRRLLAPLAAGQVLRWAFVEAQDGALGVEQGGAHECPSVDGTPLPAAATRTILSIQQALATEGTP